MGTALFVIFTLASAHGVDMGAGTDAVPGSRAQPGSQDVALRQGLIAPAGLSGPDAGGKLDLEPLVRALEAFSFGKPTCTMRIVEAGPIDQAIERALRRPVDPAIVREADCR